MKLAKVTIKLLSFLIALPVLTVYAILMQGIPDTWRDLKDLPSSVKKEIAEAMDKSQRG